MLQRSVKPVITTDSKGMDICERFNGIYLQDSRIVTLADERASVFRGGGGSGDNNTQAGVTVQVQWEIPKGALVTLSPQDAKANDKSVAFFIQPLPKGALC